MAGADDLLGERGSPPKGVVVDMEQALLDWQGSLPDSHHLSV